VRHQNPQMQERLAREYVLGTMSAAVRRRFQRLLSADSGLQRQVQHWEQHLQPLADQLPARAVWRALAQRLGHSPQGVAQKAGRGWLGSLRLWRGLTAIAGTAAFALAWLLVQTPEARPPSYLAVLEGGESATSIVATAVGQGATAGQ
jgi:anti-sigma-K factor RskA